MKEAINAKEAQFEFLKVSESDRNLAIKSIANSLKENSIKILKANELDINEAQKQGLSDATIDRLELTQERLNSIVSSVEEIANQEQVVGVKEEFLKREDGLVIQKQRIPLGVVGMIFESRPNVVIDASCLAIKSGNCIILKGGSDAAHSNKVLAEIVREAIASHIPQNVVQLINSREAVSELLSQVGFVDVIIPRGGEKLIKHVYDNSKVPVIAHFKGLCHVYIDASANLDQALEIVMNAKTQRIGVCNAMETLLLHKDIPTDFIEKLFSSLKGKECEIRTCDKSKVLGDKLATDEDWSTEYLDNILSVKTVSGIEEAISHIQKYGSKHTEAILTSDEKSIDMFVSQIDASSIMINASTRFNDGGEFGLGAEIGISTTKLHAYGPMGAKELTTFRYLVTGNGHIRK